MKLRTILFSLLAVGVLTGAVFGAAASLNVGGVDNIGAGSATITAPPDVTAVEWTVDTGNITNVSAAEITFASPPALDSDVHLQVLSDTNAPCNDGNGEASVLNVDTTADGIVMVFTFSGLTLAAADIDCVNVTVNAN